MFFVTRLSGTSVLSVVLCLATTPTLLAQTGTLSGTVYDELTAATVTGLAVELQDAGGGTLATTATDGTGAYAFSTLAAGTYLVRVPSDPARDLVGEYFDDVNEFDPDLATRLDLGVGEALTVDFYLARGGSISGTVAGLAAGEGVGLQVYDVDSGRYRGGAGSSAGAYTVESLPAASYRLFADPAGTDRAFQWYDGKLDFGEADVISVAPDADVAGKDLTLGPGRRISGHVSLDGVSDVAAAWIQADSVDGGIGWGAGTDAGGNFAVANLPPASYVVRVESGSVDEPFTAALWQDKTLRDDGDPIDVTAADTAGVDFVVHRERVISGQVFLDADGDQVQDAGEPGLGNVTVRVYDFATDRWLGHAAVDPDGRYAVGVTPGVYRVEAGPHPPNLLWESWQDAYFSEDAQPVDVSAADATSIDFGLVDGAAIGTLRGRVVDGDTLSGISGVDVQVWRFDNDHYVASAVTDAAGDFTLASLPPGSYKVFFDTQGSNAAHGTDYVASFWSAAGDPRIDYPAVPGDGTDLGSFAPATGGSISGRVYAPAGDSLPLPFDVQAEHFAGSGPLPAAAVAADGSFHLRGLPPGWLRVRAGVWGTGFVSIYFLTAAESTFDYFSATPVEVTQGVETAGIDLHLERGGAISGRVTRAADGAPLVNVPIDFSLIDDSLGRGYWERVHTDANGDYVATGLPSGDYRVRTDDRSGDYANQLTTAAVTAPGETADVDFALTAAASLRGRVYEDVNASGTYDAGEERAGVQIQAHDAATGEWLGNALAASDGRYEIGGLGAGTYYVWLEPNATNFVRMGWDNDFNQPTPVEITEAGGVPQDVGGLDFRVVQGYEIGGLVYFDADADGVRDPGEGGLSNAWVNAHPVNGPAGAWGGPRSDGTYTLHGVLPGRYTVSAGGPGLIEEYWQDVFFGEEASAVDVTSGSAAGIDFSLISGASVGTLRGRVTGSGPIPDVDVQVWRFDNDHYVAGATTDANGDFALTQLPPGSYKVSFDPSRTNADHDTDFLTTFWSSTGAPGVIDPDLLRVDFPQVPGDGTDLGTFQLATGGGISGTVFPPGGETLPAGLTVSAQSFESGGQHLAPATVDAAGNYRLRGLPAPATYRVQADAWGTGLVSVYYLTAAESTFDHHRAAAVQVGPGVATADIDLHLFRGGSISGRVTRAADAAAVAGFPINVHMVNDPLGRDYWDGAQTGPDGTYTVSGLPAGEYEVRTDARGGDLANQTYPGYVPVTEPDDTAGIDFALGPAGRVLGRVTQVVGGVTVPVAGVRVQAEDFATGEWLTDAHTDADGDYRLEALAQGRDYRIQVRPWDHPDPQFSNFIGEYWDDRLTYDEADPVTVPADPGQVVEVTGIDFELALGGAISGVVRGGGQPLQNVWVSADDDFGAGIGNGDHTDHNGLYVIRGLPRGSYRVQADPWPQAYAPEYYDDTTAWHLATPVSVAAVPAGGPVPITDNVDFDLAPAFRVSGRVTEADGTTPIADLRVSVWNNEFYQNTPARADGTWEVRGVPAGFYTVSAETEGTDWIRQEQPIEVVDADLGGVDFALRPGAVVSGRVYEDVNGNGAWDAGEERADVHVQADDYDDGQYAASGVSGADGRYAIRGLDAGRYRVYVESGEHNFVRMYYDGTFAHWNADAVDVTEAGGVPQNVGGIDFRVVRGHEIRGLVFYDANGDGIRQGEEIGLGNVSINAELQDFQIDHVWGGTDPDGTYVLHGVYPGHHLVSAHAGGTPYASELYKLVGGLPLGTYRWSEADPVDAAGGDATGIDLSLELGGGITGTVRDAVTGDGLSDIDIWVNLFDGDGLWWDTRTDAQGRYLVDGLSPGDFRIQAWDNRGVYLGEHHLDAFFQDDATPVHVVARSSPGDPLATLIDFDLDQGGAIAGRVYDHATGTGIGGVQVQADEFGGSNRYLSQATTEADGTFRIAGLPPGLDVRVWANPYPTDYIQVVWNGVDNLGSPDFNDAAPLSVAAGATTTGVDFALELGGAISGTVVDGNGDPLTGLWVNANPYDPGQIGWGNAQTDAEGAYTLHGLIPGDYRVETGSDPYPHEYYDGRTDWRLADRVSVAAGATAAGVDFVLPLVPEIVSGPSPPAGERGSTVPGVTLVAANLAGGLCGDPAVPPCVRVELGGRGWTLESPALDPASGTITFDLALAADATLGLVSLSVVNDHTVEDGVAVAANAFEIRPAAGGDVPAPASERLYVLDEGSGNVRVYGAADHSLLGTVETCPFPDHLELTPDGGHAYVACSSRRLSVVDTRLGELGGEVARIRLFGAFGTRPVALGPSYLYAVDRESADRVQVIDPVAWQVLEGEAIPLSSSPWAIRLDPAQQQLWALLRNAQSVEILDVDPASPTFHQVLETVPLPAGTVASDLAFTPDGSRAYVAAQQGIFAIDAALALSDPASAVTLAYATNSSVIEIVDHAASGKTLAFVRLYDWVGVLDVTSGPGEAELLRTFAAGASSSFSVLHATADTLYVVNADTFELYAVALDTLLAGPQPSIVRFDARADGRGLRYPGALVAAPTPAAPPASAPQVTIAGGSPATSGTPFQITLTGDHFAAAPRVGLRGTQVEGTVTAASSTGLTVDFPATTPTGDYRVVVTNPLAGGNESGLSTTSLTVEPPAGFDRSQTLYVARYGKAEIGVLRPDGSADRVTTSQAYPAHLAVTPDGRLGAVGHYDYSEWPSGQKPESVYDMTFVDLDPGSPTYLDTVGTVPWVFQAFTPAAVTPNLDNPNGVYVYAANRYMSDTVSVIDPVSRSEVDLDGDPATESIPWQHPWWWWLTWDVLPNRLAGINRIELDADVLDGNLSPTDVGLTPDGTLLYVANRAGSVSIVDAVTHDVVGQLTHGGNLTFASSLEVAPAPVQGTVYVYVVGIDAAGQQALFVFEAGQLTDAAAFVDQLVLPIQSEFPREMTMSADGQTVYLTFRYSGALVAMDAQPNQRGHYESICVTPAGTVVSQDSLCTDVSQPIPGLLHPVDAAADGLLYVNNSFGEEIWVLDATDYRLITILGDPDPTYLAIEPASTVIKPVVTGVTPGSGSPDGGDPVVITGANFQAGAQVTFGTELAGGVVVESPYVIRAVTPASVPPGATGAVEVKVENPDARTGVLQAGFTYEIDATAPVFTTPPYVASQTLAGAPGAETVTAEIRWRTDEASDSLVEYREIGAPSFLPVADPALVTDHLVTLTGLAPGTGHELQATSADAQGNPATSPLVPFTTLAAPDVTAPVITSGPTVTPAIDSAVVRWETHEVATSIVQYDAVVGDGRLDRQAFGTSGTLHSVTLTGLPAGTEHEFKVLSVDASGNGPTASALDAFTTGTLPDATPPVITAGPEPSYLGNDLVIIVWDTDEPATSFVNYGVSSIDEQGVVDLDLVTTHVVFLTNLLPGTSYGYQVGSTDPSGNTVLSADPFEALLTLGTFRLDRDREAGAVTLAADTFLTRTKAADGFTTPATPDATAPVVISVEATPLSWDRALVTVETDEAASLRARFGASGLTETAFDPAYRLEPSLLLAGLAADTTYQLTVELSDPKGNVATVDGLTFTTPAAPDVQAPVLSSLAVDAVTATSARVTWQTDEPADATVRFGPQGASTTQAGRLGLATSHAVLLSGLEPGTAYAFTASSRDASGNAGTASGSFATLAAAPVITSVTPPQAAQGAALEVTFNGARFGADAQVDFGAGVPVTGLAVNAAGSQIRAAITVAAAAPVGPRQVAVTTHGHTVSAAFAIVDTTVPAVHLTEPAEGAELTSRTIVVRGTVSEPADVTVNGVAATVGAGSPVPFEATVTLATGPTRIVATAIDASGNRGTAVVTVEVVITDTTPPALKLEAEPAVLWPPNHKMVPVAVDVQVADDQDPSPQVVLVSATSNEPDDAPGGGDGNTVNDIQGADPGTDDREVLLRAERSGNGTGRVYTLVYRATDQAGNAAEASVEVTVPLSQGKTR